MLLYQELPPLMTHNTCDDNKRCTCFKCLYMTARIVSSSTSRRVATQPVHFDLALETINACIYQARARGGFWVFKPPFPEEFTFI